MNSKYHIRLLNLEHNQILDGLPLFYDFIYYNELMDRTTEDRCCHLSEKHKSYVSFERPLHLTSLIINYEEIVSC